MDYAEIWSRTQSYATAMKAQDGAALLLGPVSWGWCDYFYSAKDGCGPGADYAQYGPFLEWYMTQVQSYLNTTGVRLIDYLDIHYYPQAQNVALSNDESTTTSALRLRTLKSLYDPSYSDESWIGQPVDLIPRMRQIIDSKCYGTKLAITEYNWGNDTGLSSALAQVEVLGIFGREGVDAAARWIVPAAGSRVEDAFKMYLDFDGAGHKATGDSISAASSCVDDVGAYAIQSSSAQLYLYFVNKVTATRAVDVTVLGGLTGTASVYGFDGSTQLAFFGTFTPSGTGFSLSMPARSTRLVVTQMNCTLPPKVNGLTLTKTGGGATLHFSWTNTTNTVDYVVLEDTLPSGTFSTVTGTATSGAVGLDIPMPSGKKCYRVAARNGCGQGPID